MLDKCRELHTIGEHAGRKRLEGEENGKEMGEEWDAHRAGAPAPSVSLPFGNQMLCAWGPLPLC